MAEHLSLRGVLKGHSNWVTAIATSSANPDMIVSASRGADADEGSGGRGMRAKRGMHGLGDAHPLHPFLHRLHRAHSAPFAIDRWCLTCVPLSLLLCRQVDHRVAALARGGQLRLCQACPQGVRSCQFNLRLVCSPFIALIALQPQPLYLGRRPLVRRPVCPDVVVGYASSSCSILPFYAVVGSNLIFRVWREKNFKHLVDIVICPSLYPLRPFPRL